MRYREIAGDEKIKEGYVYSYKKLPLTKLGEIVYTADLEIRTNKCRCSIGKTINTHRVVTPYYVYELLNTTPKGNKIR
jgi:hypothetical protein